MARGAMRTYFTVMKFGNTKSKTLGHHDEPEKGNLGIFVTAALLFLLIFASMNENWVLHGLDIARGNLAALYHYKT